MFASSFEQKIKWGIRALYLDMFIVLMATMGYWHLPFALSFVSGIMILAFTGIIFAEEKNTFNANRKE